MIQLVKQNLLTKHKSIRNSAKDLKKKGVGIMNGKKVKRIIIAAALLAVLAISGISAYFTDGDTATNTFTVGKVEIDLQEPSWNPDIATAITPKEEFPKDPKVKNIGENDAFVFLEVVVPYANVVTANDDGTKNEAADIELFSYDVNSGWAEVGEATKDADAGTITHLYAYGTGTVMTALAKDAATPTLFDYIKFANVVEDQALEGTTQNVVVNAYAIQTTNINDEKTDLDGKNDDGKVDPDAVWSVIANQSPATGDKQNEDAKTDIIGE